VGGGACFSGEEAAIAFRDRPRAVSSRSVLSEEAREDSVQLGKVREHEAAAHDARNWVRLTYDCNDRCIFCLDADTHDGSARDSNEIKAQILDGRRKGATRLILSGGEPTIHPRYVDFIKLGRLAGYPRIQTVTNGRMFSYKEFLTRAIDAGLGEITFSIHGPNARIHDALVGVKGAFDEEVRGLENALADGRVIVNIDVCVNRGNVKVLPELIETFAAKGIREFDLLQVIPFGRAFSDGRETLFYDLEEAAPHLREAFAWSQKPDFHIWLNRFPPEHCEGFEHLIQDPHKLVDEVRGRKEEYANLLTTGEPLDCREPERCRFCYLERLCDTLDEVRSHFDENRFDAIRVDAAADANARPIYGGDPASAKRIVRLPLAHEPKPAFTRTARVETAGISRAIVVAANAEAALRALEGYAVREVALELDDYSGFDGSLFDGSLGALEVISACVATTADAERLLAIEAAFDVVVMLTRESARWLETFARLPARLVVRQPNYEKVTDAREADVEPSFFERLDREARVENVPACIAGRDPVPAPRVFDTAMTRPDGSLEIFRYADRFIHDLYRVKSLRCRSCEKNASCAGVHVNYARAHGFAVLRPIAGADGTVTASEGR
jgi:MoaA/NifB/PqqE/SkfB family radical SAM enzyme